MRSVRIDNTASRRNREAVEESLDSEQFTPYEASLLLGVCGHNPHEVEAAVNRIVTAVANGGWRERGIRVMPIIKKRECCECGCTDEHACLVEGVPCFWVRDDLCSRCATLAEVESTERGRT